MNIGTTDFAARHLAVTGADNTTQILRPTINLLKELPPELEKFATTLKAYLRKNPEQAATCFDGKTFLYVSSTLFSALKAAGFTEKSIGALEVLYSSSKVGDEWTSFQKTSRGHAALPFVSKTGTYSTRLKPGGKNTDDERVTAGMNVYEPSCLAVNLADFGISARIDHVSNKAAGKA